MDRHAHLTISNGPTAHICRYKYRVPRGNGTRPLQFSLATSLLGEGEHCQSQRNPSERAVFLLWSKPLKYKPLFSNRAGESLGSFLVEDLAI